MKIIICLFFAISSLVSWFFAIREFDHGKSVEHLKQLVYTFWNIVSIICILICLEDGPVDERCYVVCEIIYLIQLIGNVEMGIKYKFDEDPNLNLIWIITTLAGCLVCTGLL